MHNGYFAQDRKGVFKDTKGDTQADDDVYNLIMNDKEQLLSNDEPLRFIFRRSALREGWDNPNVFQICTLNETKSAMKKRQEIGRGLRLPVDQDGRRVSDEAINKLYVMANESYEDFARALQTEYEEDCGVTFGKVPLTALARITRAVDGQEVPIGKDAAEAIRVALVGQKRQMAGWASHSTHARKTSSWNYRRNIPTWNHPSSTCWRPTRSSGTFAKIPTKSRTVSKRKSPSP